MNKKIKFEYADAWLLLSIIYSKQHGQATLSDIIGQGDFINHAIFSFEELQGGLYRLAMAGYIIKKNNGFLPTDKIMMSYNQFTKRRNPVERELKFIRTELNSPEWSTNYDPSKANKNGADKEITKELYDKAYKEYSDKMLPSKSRR